jgi:hypothetical protein
MKGPHAIELANGALTLDFTDLPALQSIDFGSVANVSLSSTSPALVNFDFRHSGSALHVVSGWSDPANRPGVATHGTALALSLRGRALLRYLDGSKFVVSPATLANMDFAAIVHSEITVASSAGIRDLGFAADRLIVVDIATVDRHTFTGVFTLTLESGNHFTASFHGGIPQNVRLNLTNAAITFAAEFSDAAPVHRIDVIGRDSTIYYKGVKVPSVFEVQGSNISFVHTAESRSKSIAIGVGCGVGALVLVVGIVVTVRLVLAKKKAAKEWDYDTVPPPAGSDQALPFIEL